MKKQLVLNHTGYRISGESLLGLWGSGQGTINMDTTFIPDGELTKESVLRAVNDGRFGCESILSADVDVYDCYDDSYCVFNRALHIENKHNRDRFFCRGI